jgi:hypothetical protein
MALLYLVPRATIRLLVLHAAPCNSDYKVRPKYEYLCHYSTMKYYLTLPRIRMKYGSTKYEYCYR